MHCTYLPPSRFQKEQNEIIRNVKDKVLVIQGAAGSGKTSVALHRIAYLLYHDRKNLKASDILILSPNSVFADYILYYTSINFRQQIISLEDRGMKRIKVLGSVLKRTRADKIIIGFIVFIFAIAAVIQLVEPDINRYGDALWYCYAVISTAGFGDVVAVTFIGKMCSVLLTIYSIFVVAIATGVVVNFYTQMVELQRKETLAMFMDQLERLPELSREELENISRKVRQFR